MKELWKRLLTAAIAAASLGLAACRAAGSPEQTQTVPGATTQLHLTPTELPTGGWTRPGRVEEQPEQGTLTAAAVLRYRGTLDSFRGWLERWKDPSGLGAVQIASRQELTELLAQIGFEDLTEAAADYDDAFFADHTLLLLLQETATGSVRHAVYQSESADTLNVTVSVTAPEYATDDMAQWFLLVPLERVAVDGKNLMISLTGGLDIGENLVTGATIALEKE